MTNNTDESDQSLTQTLRRSKQRRTWTEQVVMTRLREVDAVKERSVRCSDCSRPCHETELCVTVLASDSGLLDDLNRDQALHHVESGMNRLQLRDAVQVRTDGDLRPHTFVDRVD